VLDVVRVVDLRVDHPLERLTHNAPKAVQERVNIMRAQYTYKATITVVFKTGDNSRDAKEAIAKEIRNLPILDGDGYAEDTTVEIINAEAGSCQNLVIVRDCPSS